jgi:PAS domain S-box-containing protein
MSASATPTRNDLRLRALLGAEHPPLSWVVDEGGRMQEPSASWSAFTGQSAEQMRDRHWLEALHPEDRTRLAPAAPAGGSLTCRVRRADGAWREMLLRTLPVKDETGRLVEWLYLARDITERPEDRQARAEEELSQSEARFRSLVQTSVAAIWTTNAEGIPVEDAPSWRAFTGVMLEQWLGGSAWLDTCHPEDRERVAQAWQRAITTKTPYEVEGRMRHVSGSWRWVLSRAVPVFNLDGTVREWVGSNTDISEARRAEERATRLQAATSALSQALTPGDVARAILMEAMRGLGSEAGVVYRRNAEGMLEILYEVGHRKSFLDHFRTLAPDLHDNPVVDAVRTGEVKWFCSNAHLAEHYPEVAALRGLETTTALTMLPMWVNGQPVGAIVLSLPDERASSPEELRFLRLLAQQCGEALERARLYEVAEQERQRAEQASRLKDDFLGVLSHELRTPLTAILGWVQILRTRELAPDRRERALETIERNARAQTQLIEDLLDVNRIVSGKLRLDVRPTHPVKVIENALEVVRPAAEAKGLQLQALLDPEVGPLQGDPNRLQQVVWNLLSNAVKFTPQGGRVTVCLSRGPSHVEIEVKDTGDGISASFLPHVFERFRQADASSTRRHGGLGLGLAIVRQLVELHGGTVEAHSAGQGLGATFIVRLPLVAPRPDAVEPVRAQPPPGVSLPVNYPKELRGRRILVVDDDADARELLTTLFQEGGARVSSAASAAQALALLKQETPDLLVSDIGMPEMDGYALIREVRRGDAERGGRVPAVALTAYARMEDRSAALQAGFDTHVAKPLNSSELLGVAVSLLRR